MTRGATPGPPPHERPLVASDLETFVEIDPLYNIQKTEEQCETYSEAARDVRCSGYGMQYVGGESLRSKHGLAECRFRLQVRPLADLQFR